jgi:hypothetical protein
MLTELELEEIDIVSLENPTWEVRNFDEFGSFVGPKHIGELISQLIEDIA